MPTRNLFVLGSSSSTEEITAAATDAGITCSTILPQNHTTGVSPVEINGVLPLDFPALKRAVHLASELSLPHIGLSAADTLTNRLPLYETLDKANIPCIKPYIAESLDAAQSICNTLNPPFLLSSADPSYANCPKIDCLEDLPPAFLKIQRSSQNPIVLINSLITGRRFSVHLLASDGWLQPVGILERKAESPIADYDTSWSVPPSINSGERKTLFDLAVNVCKVVQVNTGCIFIDVALIQDSRHEPYGALVNLENTGQTRASKTRLGSVPIVSTFRGSFHEPCVHPHTSKMRDSPRASLGTVPHFRGSFYIEGIGVWPIMAGPASAFMKHAWNTHWAEICVRACVGEHPIINPIETECVVLRWLHAQSGVVKEIQGLEDARNLPQIRQITIGVKPGDTVCHITDCRYRDKLGYIITSGPTPESAMTSLQHALETCKIITRSYL